MFIFKSSIVLATLVAFVAGNCCLRYGQRANQLGGMDTYCQIPFPCIGGVSPPMLPQGGRFPPSGGGNWGQWGVSNIPFPGMGYPGNGFYRNARDAETKDVPSIQNIGNTIKLDPQSMTGMEFWPKMNPTAKVDPKMAVETKYDSGSSGMVPTNEINGFIKK